MTVCKRNHGKLRNGFCDNFSVVEPIDLSKCRTVNDLVTAMGKASFGARRVGEAADVLEAMVRDKDCFVVATLSGAMTMGKMGLILCDMIDQGMINAVVSTGALMAHGFVESVGKSHFKYEPHKMNDKQLYRLGYNRVYDTLELEKNLDDVEEIFNNVLNQCNPSETLCSRTICEALGKYLVKNTRGRGVLKSAFLKGVPVYIPAFTDSELGLDFGLYNRKRKMQGKEPLNYNPFIDLEHFTELIKKQRKIGIFTIGGGVPRNWAQQVTCYLDIIQKRAGEGGDDKKYHYGVRICPEPVHFGGLSGCTYSEGVSWGKLAPKEDGGMWAEVLEDATIVWPMLVKAVLERLEKNPAPEKHFATQSISARAVKRTIKIEISENWA